MPYYFGTVAAVPTAGKQAYLDHATRAWTLFKRHGATRMVEGWGVDVPHGQQTDFHRAVQARDDETPVFSWIEWPDRAAADAAWESMQGDPDMQTLGDMPFDGTRLIYGGFSPIYSAGSSAPGRYVQGFVLAVPWANQQAYADTARSAEEMFMRLGAQFITENWGEDVTRGKQTDFYRATEAREDEVPMFSWIEWPDRATCDAAAQTMMAEMEDSDFPEMPFDGKRMFWGGFEPILDQS